MNIVHLTPYYAPAFAFGGVVRSVEGMARALARRGHTVTVLTTDALDATSRCTDPADTVRDGVRVLRARNLSVGLRGRLNLGTPFGLHQLATDILPTADVLHVHEFRTVENLLVIPAAAQRGIPVALSPHGTLPLTTGRSAFKTLWDRWLSPRIAPHIGALIALTQDEATEARACWQAIGQPPALEKIVPNGVNPQEFAALTGREAFRQRYGLGDGAVCLFMGRLHPRKGADVLAEAFLRLDLPDARLVIVGPDEGLWERLQTFAGERVILTGYLGGADRLAALAAADLFVLPAVGEGLPMAALEAMAAGLPVILSPECHLPEAATAGAGLEVPPTADALAPALHALLSDRQRRQTMGAAARQLVEQHFTWDAVAAQLEDAYAHLKTASAKR